MADQNALSVPEEVSSLIAPSKYGDDDAFTSVASASYLPRLNVMTGGSDLVQSGKMQVGRWALIQSKDQGVDLGAEAHVFILGWRPKAMDLSNPEQVVSVFNPKKPEFTRIMEKSETPNSNCLYGPEFLVYVPSVKQFALMLLGSKTARKEAGNARGLVGKFATLRTRFIETPKHKWHGPVISVCSTTYDLPNPEKIADVLNKFNNPPEDEIEAAPAEAASRER